MSSRFPHFAKASRGKRPLSFQLLSCHSLEKGNLVHLRSPIESEMTFNYVLVFALSLPKGSSVPI